MSEKCRTYVPLGRRIDQDCRRPNRERISGEARIKEHIPDVAIDAVIQRVSVEGRGVEVVRRAETAEFKRHFFVRELLLEKDLIQERPLSADHLLYRVDTSDVFSRKILASAIDPADHEQPAFPADELFEIEFQPCECVIHDRRVTGMNSAAYVAVEDAVIERENLHARREQPFAPSAAVTHH